jgi:hypothetical protein
MTMTNTQKILWTIIILLVLVFIFIAVKEHGTTPAVTMATSTTQTSSSTATTIPGTNIQVQGNGNYTITPIPVTGQMPQGEPDLNATVHFGTDPSLSPDIRATVEQKVSAAQAILKSNPTDVNTWINLGIYQKMGGDYTATIASWTYAGKLSPTNYISFGDLGDLYAYFLHDTTTAEKYYTEAIANGPTQAYLYIQLAEIYHDIDHNSAHALTTINQGLTKIPNDPSLLSYKASLSQ